MQAWKFLPLSIILILAACSAPPPSTETEVALVIETPDFPPTWTPTGEVFESASTATPEPQQRTEATITPTNTATLTSTADITRPPSATPELANINCTISTDQQGIELYQAPYFSDYRILPTMEAGFSYTAADVFPTMVRLLREGQTIGWVDYRQLAVKMDGPDCLELQYPGELSDFDAYLCFMVADPPVDTYYDEEFTEITGMMIGPNPYYVVTTLGSEGPRGSCAGHAGPCFRVDPTTVDTVGNCDDLPRSAETIVDTQLWSQPDGNAGSPIRELPAGKFVAVQYGESVTGPAPPGAPIPGTWLLVKLSGSDLPRHGWVWSEFVSYR
jgi:hypothetical protein